MCERESFPSPLDTTASSMYPIKSSRGGSMFSCFPIPSRHSHSHSSSYYKNRYNNTRSTKSYTDDMIGRGGDSRGCWGRGDGRGYYYASSRLPPSFITREEEEAEHTGRRNEDSHFPDINNLTFPSPSKHRYQHGGTKESKYLPLTLPGLKLLSKGSHHRRHGSFSSVCSYNVPPDFHTPTSRGRNVEERRGTLCSPNDNYYNSAHDTFHNSGYMSL